MAITQLNVYSPGQNLNNAFSNIDYNRIENDQSYITVNFGTTPATVTVKIGSLIEVNGNLYTIDTADETFQMANTTDNYITFDGTNFDSSSTQGTFDPLKQGYYISGTERILKWYIDQTVEDVSLNMDFIHKEYRFKTLVSDHMDHMSSHMTGTTNITVGNPIVLPFGTVLHDVKNLYNNITYTYNIRDNGIYSITSNVLFNASTLPATLLLDVLVNSVSISSSSEYKNNIISFTTNNFTRVEQLNAGDTVQIQGSALSNNISISGSSKNTNFSIDRLF